jgi:tetratricopeptide (TPR) repeat protein
MLIRPIHQEQDWELLHWAAAIALALALALAFATAVGAADIPPKLVKPKLLPAEITDWAQPMQTDSVSAYAGENADVGRELWRILQLHQDRKHDAAIQAWNNLAAPPETEAWKRIALGQALVATDRFEAAEECLASAIDMQPDNAVAHYFLGVLRMQQAYLAAEWPDVVGAKPTRLVAQTPRHVVPNTKGMYELAATVELEKAIELAAAVRLDAAILSSEHSTTTALEPTVGDLLLALGAEHFPAKAHNTLSYLFLERGALEIAESHMDDAVRGGLSVVYGYQDLGDGYHVRGQYADAARAYLKATRFSSNKLGTALDALRSLREAFTKP